MLRRKMWQLRNSWLILFTNWQAAIDRKGTLVRDNNQVAA
jgi:hypothetical protein